MQTENELNAEILKLTLVIREQYPELIKYLDEEQVTLPDEKNPEINRKNLKAYYDTLNTMLHKYRLEHQEIKE